MSPSTHVKAVFVVRSTWLWDGVFLPNVASRPQLMDTECSIRGQGRQQKRAVGRNGQSEFAVKVRMVSNVMLAECRSIINPDG